MARAMNSAERAARLALVDTTPPPGNAHGGWRYRIVAHGAELQLRNRGLPHLRLDLTRGEAVDLALSLSHALGDAHLMPTVRVGWLQRARDWLARRTWRRKHAVEQAHAAAELAREFAESRGGWG